MGIMLSEISQEEKANTMQFHLYVELKNRTQQTHRETGQRDGYWKGGVGGWVKKRREYSQ